MQPAHRGIQLERLAEGISCGTETLVVGQAGRVVGTMLTLTSTDRCGLQAFRRQCPIRTETARKPGRGCRAGDRGLSYPFPRQYNTIQHNTTTLNISFIEIRQARIKWRSDVSADSGGRGGRMNFQPAGMQKL
jgi:hypothetical protein